MAQIGPQLVPSEDFLVDKVGAGRSILLTAVGYGTGEAHNKPDDGGNPGGVEPDPSWDGPWKVYRADKPRVI